MTPLVDTNVVSELVRRSPNRGVLSWFHLHPAFAISAITLEELVYGVDRLDGGRRARMRDWLDALLATGAEVVPVDDRIAQTAGRLRADRDREGRPASQGDMLIGATAVVTRRVIVTRNVRDFVGLGLRVVDPFV
ncbi:MAG: PIN domain-containing protein [Deltaproteobacteria bacterium]|nr:PIN domain-containing protein [Deltaproteobacteria bacterium]